MNACSKSLKPLVNSCFDNVMVKIVPDLNQPPFQFISALDVCMVNTFLNGPSYLIVNWVDYQAVWMTRSSRIKFFFSLHS